MMYTDPMCVKIEANEIVRKPFGWLKWIRAGERMVGIVFFFFLFWSEILTGTT